MGRGALVFKGDAPKKKSKKQSKHISKKESPAAAAAAAAAAQHHALLPPVVRPQQKPQAQQEVPEMKEGTGRITTSGTVVTGHGTTFDKELNQGDALIIMRDDQQEEMRVVTMRISNNSCAISSAFSVNCKLPTPFFIINKPRNREQERLQRQQKALQEQKETEQTAFGTYANNDELVYREKTEHGSYRIQRVKVDSKNTTRGDLLEMRAKKKADKYC